MRILLNSFFVFVFIGCASYPKKNGLRPVQNTKGEILEDSMSVPNQLGRQAQSRTGDRSMTTLNPYFSDVSKDYIYKAQIDAFDNSFGGLLIIKKLGAQHHRIVFTTEMGNTLADFTIQGDEFKVNSILKEMDRKLLINTLKRDFKTLITEQHPIIQIYTDKQDIIYETKIFSKKHYFYCTKERLHKIVRIGRGKEKVVFIYSEIQKEVAGKIEILHKTFPLIITLHSI